MTTRTLALTIAAVVTLCFGGCSLFRRKAKTPAPPPPVAATVTPQPRPCERPMPEPKLPEPTVAVPKPEPQAVPPAPRTAEAELPQPKPETKASRRRSRQSPAAKPVTTEQAVSTEPPHLPPPRLGEVLTEGRRKELLSQLDGNVGSARQILTALAGRNLSREQSESASRARAFIEQALGMRESDPSTALELSRRALVLAQDLAGNPP